MIELVKGKDLIDFVKDIDISILKAFLDTYLLSHYYLKSSKVAISYMCEYYNLNRRSNEYRDILNSLSHRFKLILMDYLKCGLIKRYTKHLYCRCECEIDDLKGFLTRSGKL